MASATSLLAAAYPAEAASKEPIVPAPAPAAETTEPMGHISNDHWIINHTTKELHGVHAFKRRALFAQWKHDPQQGDFTNVHQDAAIDELQEIHFDKHLKDNLSLTGFQRLATILNPIRDPSLKGNQAEGALNGLSLGLTGFQRIGMSSPVLRHRELTF